MSVTEENVTGKKYRVWDKLANKWKRYSFWTKASDVELANGDDVETAISDIKTSLSTDEGKITTLQENVVWYGTSTTSSSTTSKVATTNDSKFKLVTGAKVRIKFTYTNTASSPTLNIDSKGAKYIKAYGTTTPTVWWKAGDVVDFVYDGTYWIMGATEGQITQLNQDLTTDEVYNTNGIIIRKSGKVVTIETSDTATYAKLHTAFVPVNVRPSYNVNAIGLFGTIGGTATPCRVFVSGNGIVSAYAFSDAQPANSDIVKFSCTYLLD